LFKFDDRLVGQAGGIDVSRVAVRNLTDADVVAASTPAIASVGAVNALNDAAVANEVVLPTNVTVIGNAGLNVSRVEAVKSQIRDSVETERIHTKITGGLLHH
jgi:hypothetical protein